MSLLFELINSIATVTISTFISIRLIEKFHPTVLHEGYHYTAKCRCGKPFGHTHND